MKTQIVSFKGRKERVQFKNTPENFENNKNAFEKVAKKNKVELSIRRSLENKYLPQSDAYIILVTRKKPFKNGIGCVITDKKTDSNTLLEKIMGSVQRTISKTANNSNKKTGFIRKVLNFFKRK